ncbi:RDD family protein [Nonomuraea sp. B19D2]|uniref:RDD family protein n=1 Tax=Nonomuraea sp. B19D2 TaxID=3159561 RepID=UPI0032DA8EF5
MGVQPPGAPAPLAEWWQRLVARIIDFVILFIVNVVIGFILVAALAVSYSSIDGTTSGLLSGTVVGMITAVIVTALWIAYDFFLLKMNGQTVGKMVMGIKVVPVGQGMPPKGLPTDLALKRAAVTWGGWALNVLPLGFISSLLGYIVVGLNGASQLWDKPLQQTFADKLATTVVVKIK